jgi:hypothetical protein
MSIYESDYGNVTLPEPFETVLAGWHPLYKRYLDDICDQNWLRGGDVQDVKPVPISDFIKKSWIVEWRSI